MASQAVVEFSPRAQVIAPPSFSMSDMERVALAIAKGGLFGSTDPNAVLTLCMLAQAEGQHPAVVFRDYHIIQGKPAKKSEAMQRDFLLAGGKIEWHQLDDDCVDATFSHPAGGSVRIAWDNARVAQAQLGSNPMHKKYPRQMKKARVIAEGVRTVWPSATSGLYESGEVQDIVHEDGGRNAKPATPAPKRARDLKNETPQDDNPGRTKAEAWVADQLASVASAADLEALDAVIQGGHKAVAKLAREHADLHGRVQAAYEERTAELQGFTEEPEDLGGPMEDDAPPQWEGFHDGIARRTSAATTAAELDEIGEDLEKFEGLPDDKAAELLRAIAKRRREVKG